MIAKILSADGKLLAQTTNRKTIEKIHKIIMEALIMKGDYSAGCVFDLPKEEGGEIGG